MDTCVVFLPYNPRTHTTDATHIEEHDDGAVAAVEGDGARVAALVVLQRRVCAGPQEEAHHLRVALCVCVCELNA